MAYGDTRLMCGRFSLFTVAEVIAKLFGLGEVPDLEPRYNIAPTQQVAAVRLTRHGDGSPEGDDAGEPAADPDGRILQRMHWGFVPHWAKDPDDLPLMINARAEELFERPAFRTAATHTRCLIPADGFYEWKRVKGGKQPMFIRRVDREPFAFAGLWSVWDGRRASRDREGSGAPLVSCTIITTTPNETVAPIHDRMPVIVPRTAYADWLDPATDRSVLEAILDPHDVDALEAYPVSEQVNRPAHEGEALIRRAGQETLF